MRKHILPALGGSLLLLAGAQAAILALGSGRLTAFAAPAELLKGCDDVPEAVVLAQTLQERSLRIERYLQDIESKKAEVAAAEAELTQRLAEIKKSKEFSKNNATDASKGVTEDVDRLIAVYDQMKPDQAATVLSNLPPEFAAEILMRVQPENGARIIASVDPAQAAVLTTYMGARRAREK
ncbi:hypothetical protein QWZ10_13165 [Paracoccus cavernae]|uniref:Magnesium transporter MgtE intracellular domain-containing protein n=1 Tax=Paracoccus cavernae TaxID=1571207 RepID=A0ABT8D978_9RHOB|nr:hypothetical protein [Paracoccus cavernae]